MKAVFADSGYWIALWRPRDALHEKAMSVAESLGEIAVVTTQLVLTEALNAMAGAGEFHRRVAVRMVRQLTDHPNVEIVPQLTHSSELPFIATLPDPTRHGASRTVRASS